MRIALGVAAGLLLLVGWMVLWFRGPVFGELPFPSAYRADPARLEQHVRFLAVVVPSRHWRDREGTERATAYIARAFAASGARCSEQRYRANDLEAENLIASFGPTHGPRVIVGAHYDVFGHLPGADDNASGVAGLLELARLLQGVQLRSPVDLVAYGTEESPFFGGDQMGSAVHAKSLAHPRRQVEAMIALEMIGYFSPVQPNKAWLLSLLYPRKGNFIAVIGRSSDGALVGLAKRAFRGADSVPVVSYTGPVAIGSDLSDHRSYWAQGFPACMVTDTAYLRNPHYHTALDTPATLDYRAMASVVDGVFSSVYHLAEQGVPQSSLE